VTVFNSLYAEHYDQFYSAKSYDEECDLIEAALARYGDGGGKALLDIGCGTGGHSLELARRGYAMTGVDLSPSMVAQARAKGEALPESERPAWLVGDARTFEAGGPFDAAIMMFAVVGYLTANDDVMAGLRNIRRHLRPGAAFVCDFWYGPSVLVDRPTDRIRVLEAGSRQIIRATNTTLDVTRHTADVSFRLWSLDEGRLVSESSEMHQMRYFFPQEYAFMLSQAGFDMVGISAFPSLDQPLTDETWNAVVVAIAR
jgi:SAM-dependent methyltransferase